MDLTLIRCRALRRSATPAESLLWSHLRAKRLVGFKFRRQHPVGPYILDFYCAGERLAVELDGGQHFGKAAQEYDEHRTAFLLRRGVRVLRFANDVVFREREAVLESILSALGVGPSP
jgi:very-short-patch-repair endonuclease